MPDVVAERKRRTAMDSLLSRDGYIRHEAKTEHGDGQTLSGDDKGHCNHIADGGTFGANVDLKEIARDQNSKDDESEDEARCEKR